MKKNLLLIIATAIALTLNINSSAHNRIDKINADSLLANIEKYINKEVEIEGTIVHVCGVDSLKMKLKTDNGAYIKIVNQETDKGFPTSLVKKRIKVVGIVTETRIEKSYTDTIEKEKLILCHIDKKPCKDLKWAENQKKAGKADSLSKQSAIKLRKEFAQSKKDYVSIITIIAVKYELLNSSTK